MLRYPLGKPDQNGAPIPAALNRFLQLGICLRLKPLHQVAGTDIIIRRALGLLGRGYIGRIACCGVHGSGFGNSGDLLDGVHEFAAFLTGHIVIRNILRLG
ncbi:hypothetical protein D3C75_932630 [compost metagenome]